MKMARPPRAQVWRRLVALYGLQVAVTIGMLYVLWAGWLDVGDREAAALALFLILGFVSTTVAMAILSRRSSGSKDMDD